MKDKVIHCIIGFGIAFFNGLVSYQLLIDDAGNVANSVVIAAVFVALVSAALAGGVKEWCDMHNKGNKWDWRDFSATAIGGIIAALILLGIHFGQG